MRGVFDLVGLADRLPNRNGASRSARPSQPQAILTSRGDQQPALSSACPPIPGALPVSRGAPRLISTDQQSVIPEAAVRGSDR